VEEEARIGLSPCKLHIKTLNTVKVPHTSYKEKQMSDLLSLSKDSTPRKIHRRRSFVATKAKKKRVQFASFPAEGGEDNCPIEQVHNYPPVPEELLSLVYWQQTDFELMRAERRKLASELVDATPKLVDAIRQLHSKSEDFARSQKAKLVLLDSLNSRGLESWMMPLSIAKYKQSAIDKLLDVQDKCELNEKHPDHVEFQLSVWSMRLGAPSCRFARKLAEMDEMEAFDRVPKERLNRAAPPGRTKSGKVAAEAA
jgi:hypothetical protein